MTKIAGIPFFIILFVHTAVFMMLFARIATADYQAGIDAYKNGEFSTAYTAFKTLAENGDHLAQFYMGVMHQEGQAVEKDMTAAARWFRLSSQGALRSAETSSQECRSQLTRQQGTIDSLQKTIDRIRHDIERNPYYGTQ